MTYRECTLPTTECTRRLPGRCAFCLILRRQAAKKHFQEKWEPVFRPENASAKKQFQDKVHDLRASEIATQERQNTKWPDVRDWLFVHPEKVHAHNRRAYEKRKASQAKDPLK